MNRFGVLALAQRTVPRPGLERDDWPLDDPEGKPRDRVRRIRDDVRRRVAARSGERVWG